MTQHDYTRALKAVPNPDKYTHGDRAVISLSFDEMRAIRHALEALSAPKIDFEGLKRDATRGWKNFDQITAAHHVIDHIAAKYPQLRGK